MKKQRGITLGGVFLLMILIGFGVYTASRIMPGFMQYWTLQQMMKNIVQLPEIKDMKERAIRDKFSREILMNNMETDLRDSLEVEFIPNGVRLALEFSVRRPFMGPISFCMDFRVEETSK
jgi:hypothetical protein